MSKADLTRQHIIEKAAPIFNKYGYEGTSMALLTDATGLTKGALYGNFTNKDEIALEALEYNISRISNLISEAVTPQKNSCDKLIAFAGFYRDFFATISQQGGCPILNAAVDSDNTGLPLRDVVIRWLDVWMGTISSIIRSGIEKREIRKAIDPVAYATLFVSLIEGGIMLSKVMGSRVHLERNVAFIIDTVNNKLRR
ncbi:MAG TPA: TetR/AcrR family transcriptional regulator [Deltaproteobacteria bacterium]|nr:TetR/AcrR family transcriptional regulator [Deltaproteobacteria bacterium]HPR56034.1 TetR/AcrR family transcriptional regulator [Deltaproteobacteria bacterium]HXK46969.1 TetR/AcrR family transcriptional regulator [Deltaproteobacteria bacterium]